MGDRVRHVAAGEGGGVVYIEREARTNPQGNGNSATPAIRAKEEPMTDTSEAKEFVPTSLDTILEENESQETEPQTAEANTEETPQNATPAKQGEETPDEKSEETETKDEPGEGRQVPLQALRDERKKRQELELKLARIEGREEARGADQAAQEQPPQKSFWDYEDPNEAVREIAYTAVMQDRLERSVVKMREQHEDYNEMEVLFATEMRKNPQLETQMRAHPYPAEFAYNWAKQHQQARQYGTSIDEIRENIRAEERAKLEAESKKDTALADADQAPKTQANARGGGGKTEPEWAGPTPLSDIAPTKW